MALEEVVNEHFLGRYRALLDAEGAAFDELEHAYEDGDREHFLADLAAWEQTLELRRAFLLRSGLALVAGAGAGLGAARPVGAMT